MDTTEQQGDPPSGQRIEPMVLLSAKDHRAIAMNAANREAQLAARLVRVSRGRGSGFARNDARRDALIERMRQRLIRMVERNDRDGVGARR